LILRGKITFLPRKSKNAGAAKEIFKRVREIENSNLD
jgi:hypothetical protein